MTKLAFPLGGGFGGEAGGGYLDLTEAEREVFEWLVSLWPPGARDLYDIDGDSDVARYFAALAQAFARFGTAPVDHLRVELSPAACVEKLPDWETALGLPTWRRLAPSTTAGRQAAIVSKLRESGSYSIPELQAILGPLLGYVDPTKLRIVETDRVRLRALHTYTNVTPIKITAGGSVTQVVDVTDDGAVSAAGVQILVTKFSASSYADVVVRLAAPDGTTETWSGAGLIHADNPLTLRSLGFAGARVLGGWTLTVSSIGGSVSADDWRLFAEGAGRDAAGEDGRGSEVFWWAPFADPLLAGAAGPVDLEAARMAISRVKPAHTRASVVTTTAPKPGALVPSQFIPRWNP